jgi:ubiquinone/menaquinone biosynthesis C-methylase UbiE
MSTASDRDQQERVRERFTRTAEAFGDFAVARRGREAELLARLLRVRGHEQAVDLACGPGTLALVFAHHVRWICGVDLTPAMLERARRSALAEKTANLAFVLGNALELPFPGASLDTAVTSYSLHHIPDPARVIREIARVLKPGGRAGLIDLVVPEVRAIAEMNNRIERTRDSSHARTLAKSEFETMLTAAGLRLLAAETEEHPRSFDHWMQVGGWGRGDRAYADTRRLMEASIPGDSAGFHPRLAPADSSQPGSAPNIEMIQTVFFVAAEKIG